MNIRTAVAAAVLLSTQSLGYSLPHRAGGQLFVRPRKRGFKAWRKRQRKQGKI